MTQPSATPQPADENALILERRGKLAALRGQGVAFPNDFRRRNEAGALQGAYADAERWTGEALEAEGVRVAVAGRLMAKRIMGKAAFAKLRDVTGDIQLFLQSAALGRVVKQDRPAEAQRLGLERLRVDRLGRIRGRRAPLGRPSCSEPAPRAGRSSR